MVRHKELHFDPDDTPYLGDRNHPVWNFLEPIKFKLFKVKNVELPLTFPRSITFFTPFNINEGSGFGDVLVGWFHFQNPSTNGRITSAVATNNGNLDPTTFGGFAEAASYFETRLGGAAGIQCEEIRYIPDLQRFFILWSGSSLNTGGYNQFMIKDPQAARVLGFEPGINYAMNATATIEAVTLYTGGETGEGGWILSPLVPQPRGINYVYLRSNSLSLQYGVHNTSYGPSKSTSILARIPLYPKDNDNVVYWVNKEAEFLNFANKFITHLDLYFTSESLREVRIGGLLWRDANPKFQPLDLRGARWSLTFLLGECMCPNQEAAFNQCKGI